MAIVMTIALKMVVLVMRKLSLLALIAMGGTDNCNRNCNESCVGDGCASDEITFLSFPKSSEHKAATCFNCNEWC
eukprot:14653547-Ditylum_brightwellii.AAC.1